MDNPNGLTYTLGQNQWPRDWSYIIPASPDATGVYQPSTGTITFNLPAAPAVDAKASVYLVCAGDENGGVIVKINGTNFGSAPNVTGKPNPVVEVGFDPPATYSDDSAEHYSDHGPFFDERINFPGSLMHEGANTLSIQVAGKKGMPYLMLDYLRLELTGYVPPAPTSIMALAGNGRNLVIWPVVAGATSYNILRRTTPGSGYSSLASDVTGPVAGSRPSLASYTDTTAANGTAYSYVVQSVNPVGTSRLSTLSAAATPLATPDGMKVVTSGHHLVSLRWSASLGVRTTKSGAPRCIRMAWGASILCAPSFSTMPFPARPKPTPHRPTAVCTATTSRPGTWQVPAHPRLRSPPRPCPRRLPQRRMD